MTKILMSADWHINLHKKSVPYDWQINRFKMFFESIYALEPQHDIHIIAGDVFDKKPQTDEICLLLDYLNKCTIPTYIIPGNHEATRKGESFLEHFIIHNAVNNDLVKIYTKNTRVIYDDFGIQFYPYGEMQKNNLPEHHPEDILITHIRGEIPPHVTEEYDFELIRPWRLTLLGDLHFYHKYKDFNVWYPGSPMNVTFDRNPTHEYGVLSIDSTNMKPDFIQLDLPKLLRATISVGEDMVKDNWNHVIYEVTGSVDELAKVKDNVLLDKKIAHKPDEDSVLDLKDLSVLDELKLYLEYSKVEDVSGIMVAFVDLNIGVE